MNLGVVNGSCSAFVVDALAPESDTELGIYSETGQLIAHNDDVVFGPDQAGLLQS